MCLSMFRYSRASQQHFLPFVTFLTLPRSFQQISYATTRRITLNYALHYRLQRRIVTMTSPPMEVEIKIRLPGREDYDKLVSILEKTLVSTEYQENHFFDGPNSELREKRNVLRTRLIQEMKKDEIVDKYAVVTLKGNAQLVDGISRVEEYEDRIGWDDAKAICAEPARLLQLEQHYSQLEPIREVRQRFPQLESLKEIGTFTNIRKLHCWEDHELALDHTTFAFGHAYEIEVETDTPEMLKEKLLALLKQHQIEHTDSTSNKFAIMMRNSL